LAHNGTVLGVSEPGAAALPPGTVRMWVGGRHGDYRHPAQDWLAEAAGQAQAQCPRAAGHAASAAPTVLSRAPRTSTRTGRPGDPFGVQEVEDLPGVLVADVEPSAQHPRGGYRGAAADELGGLDEQLRFRARRSRPVGKVATTYRHLWRLRRSGEGMAEMSYSGLISDSSWQRTACPLPRRPTPTPSAVPRTRVLVTRRSG
jgi:hypothetical protein